MFNYLELKVDQLLLDEENPRLGSAGNRLGALEALIERNPDHFRNMMLSIKENGLDPGDNFYVINAPKKGRYIVLEGNRRLSALKVLFNPDVLSDTNLPTADRESLRRAALGFNRSQFPKIKCIRFKNRAEAKKWIKKRHTGSMDGEGRIDWSPSEIQRFNDDMSILDVIDFIERNAGFTPAEWKSAKSKIVRGKWSTVARLLDSTAGREHIGILIMLEPNGRKTPHLTRNPSWAASVLKKIIEDIRDDKVNSRKLNTLLEIEKYFNSLPKALQPKGKPVASKAFKDITLKTSRTPQKKPVKPKPKTVKAPRLGRTLAPEENSFRLPKSRKGQRLLREATMINVDDLTISAAAVLRAFLELALNQYMDNNSLPRTYESKGGREIELGLTDKAKSVMNHIKEERRASRDDMQGFESKVVNRNAESSIQSLHSIVHNKYRIPVPDEVLACWESCVPVFEAAFGKV